ncbi:hypothetical protein LINPERHAP2_LOCUS15218, partial [Linum perenne]
VLTPAQTLSRKLLSGSASLVCLLNSSRKRYCAVSVTRLENLSESTRRRLLWREGITPGFVSVWTYLRSSYRNISCFTEFDA